MSKGEIKMNLDLIKDRLKSKIVWVGIAAQVVLLVALFNPDLADTIKVAAASAVEIATMVGLLNNPSDKENF